MTWELALIAAVCASMILAGAGSIAVGVWVLIRTARVSALEQAVDNLGEMLRSYRNRDARREVRSRAPSKGARQESSDLDANGTEISDPEAKKRAIYSDFLRGVRK